MEVMYFGELQSYDLPLHPLGGRRRISSLRMIKQPMTMSISRPINIGDNMVTANCSDNRRSDYRRGAADRAGDVVTKDIPQSGEITGNPCKGL